MFQDERIPQAPLVGFTWNSSDFSQLTMEPAYKTDIVFSPCASGQAAQITVNGIPCGQLSVPVGFIEGKCLYNSTYYNLPIGKAAIHDGKRFFTNVYFPKPEIDSATDQLSYSMPIEDFVAGNGNERPPAGSIALVFYRVGNQAHEDLPVNIFDYGSNSSGFGSAISFFEEDGEKYQACLVRRAHHLYMDYEDHSTPEWEEIETQNGIYVHTTDLDGSNFTSPDDDIERNEVVLPDPNTIAENLLLEITYNKTRSYHRPSGGSSYNNIITDPASIYVNLYYKGIIEKLNLETNNYETAIGWVRIRSFGSSVDYLLVLTPSDVTEQSLDKVFTGFFVTTSGYPINSIALEDLDGKTILTTINTPYGSNEDGYDHSDRGRCGIIFTNATYEGRDISEDEPYFLYIGADYLLYDGPYGFASISTDGGISAGIYGFLENYNFEANFDNNSGLVASGIRGFVPAPTAGLSGNAVLTTNGWQESNVNWNDWAVPSNP